MSPHLCRPRQCRSTLAPAPRPERPRPLFSVPRPGTVRPQRTPSATPSVRHHCPVPPPPAVPRPLRDRRDCGPKAFRAPTHKGGWAEPPPHAPSPHPRPLSAPGSPRPSPRPWKPRARLCAGRRRRREERGEGTKGKRRSGQARGGEERRGCGGVQGNGGPGKSLRTRKEGCDRRDPIATPSDRTWVQGEWGRCKERRGSAVERKSGKREKECRISARNYA